ncbi:hypothetical protein BDP27DRAFT_1417523 [Rhodocollybia butyracea]|uniref:Uncharacterized protein n=1 Tax=Rhodocollybia butyracea TaxID=206335 RepID=A0A9P5Q1J0_9AGAR|nr:hypothetical protein BDP27DRAFT_1417523 [Rhodocollybia butyracea]
MADWQNIPQELIDRFVDESRWDVDTLKNLSLVSRPWLSRTRHYLFHSITLAPRDIKEIYEYKSYLTRAKTSPTGSTRYYVPMSLEDRRLLDSSLDPTPQNVFLSSTPNILHHVRCLHLESSIRIGGSRKLTPIEYFQRYLGFGEDSLIVRDLTSDEGLFDLQQKRWASVDLPWGQFGLLELPFCKLQYVHIQWSVFSWMLDDSEVPSGQWLGFQFGVLLKANEGTLDHVSIDEYPGFAWREEDSSELVLDGLLHLLAQNAPQIRTLCLQGPLLPRRRASRRHSAMHPTPNVWDRPLARYPSGEEVPPVFSNPDDDDAPSNGELSIKHLFLRGFTSDSMVLIEDAFLNSSVLSRLESLALSAMPDGFNYKVFLSTLRHSLTHLTLEFNESSED